MSETKNFQAFPVQCIVYINKYGLFENYSKQCTLSKLSNWSHYIFYACFESKIRLYKIHASLNQPRFCRDAAGHFI